MKSAHMITGFYCFVILCFASISAVAQCPSGAVGISGGGCMSGCNLTSLGGPNCVPPVTGNATTATVFTNIVVPAGCVFTVSAVMSNRAGACSASGADAGDGMKVDIPGGPKPILAGAGNATLTDSYTLTGPGTIRVTCVANRQDEIVTYSTSSTGCVNCITSLPVELSEFKAVKGTDYVDLLWTTLSERDNDYFTIERSRDGEIFEESGVMNGAGNSTALINYMNRDIFPLEGTSYYRIKQTDTDGKFTYSEIRSVTFGERVDLYPNPANGSFVLRGHHLAASEIVLTNAVGQQVQVTLVSGKESITADVSQLPEGIYFVTVVLNGTAVCHKLAVNH